MGRLEAKGRAAAGFRALSRRVSATDGGRWRFAWPWSRTKSGSPLQMRPRLFGGTRFPDQSPMHVSYTAQHEMRRAISIALLMIVSWMLVVPLLPSPVEAAMSCCRMSGKHHCTCCSARSGDTSGAPSVSRECPCPQPLAAVAHSSVFAPEAGQQEHLFASISGLVIAHPSGFSPKPCLHAWPKRGPPTSLS